MGHVLQRGGWTGWAVGTLQEDAQCRAGLVLKHRLNPVHPPSGHSLKTEAAFGAEELMPSPSRQHPAGALTTRP